MEHEYCSACDFDGVRYDNSSLLNELRALGPRWRSSLAASGPELRARPEPEVWSPLEYAAHSRDITALHVFGVEQALTRDEPSFPPIEGDLVDSAAASYGGADPDEVLDALDQEATRLAQLADDAGAGRWSRGLTIGAHRSECAACWNTPCMTRYITSTTSIVGSHVYVASDSEPGTWSSTIKRQNCRSARRDVCDASGGGRLGR